MEGSRLEDYELVKELGRGANGVVYLARKRGLERSFAIKVLLRPESAEAIARFHREARLASALEDAGIVSVLDLGTDARGRPFFAMEYCPGGTLQHALRAGPLRIPDALALVAELARVLALAHAAGMIHRDVKPANVILDETTGKPRLTDFGLARDLSATEHLTRTGDVVGTPLYMAPEQLAGKKGIDHRVDVYALGVILYEALTGRRPHEAASVVELAKKVGREPILPPSALRPEVDELVNAICLRALATNPDERYRDARALRSDLLAAHERLTKPKAPPEDRARPARRPVLAVVLAGVVVAAVSGGAIAWRSRSVPAPAPPVPAPAPPPVAPPQPVAPPAPSPAQAALARDLAKLANGDLEAASILVWDPGTRRALFALDEARVLTPGACVQVLTMAAALRHVPLLAVETTVRLSEKPDATGAVSGVVVVGSGDPLLPKTTDREWAEALVAAGVKRVRGDLIVDARAFAVDERVHPEWDEDDRRTYQGAAVSALAFNDACADVRIVPKLIVDPGLGRYAHAMDDPAASVPWFEDRSRGWLLHLPVRVHDRRYDVPVPDPDLFLGECLLQELENHGVTVEGSVRVASAAESFENWQVVPACTRSVTVQSICEHVGRRAQGWYAECLLRILGRAVAKDGTFAGGVKVVTDFAVKECEAPASEVRLRDGSGLSPEARLSARALVRVVERALEGPAGRDSPFAEALNQLPAERNVIDPTAHYNLGWLGPIESALAQKGVVLRGVASKTHGTATFAGSLERGRRRIVVALLARPDRRREEVFVPFFERLVRYLSEER